MDSPFLIDIPFAKTDDAERVVYGWASVVSEGGQPVTDTQGDVIDANDLAKAAHAFMAETRTGGLLHVQKDGKPVKVGEVVESIVLRNDVQKAMGINLGREGWFIGFKVHDDGVWKRVKDGTLKAFSIGGRGTRQAMEE